MLESYDTLREAIAYCRARRGPALVHAHVIRPYSHSLSDDESQYRPTEELQLDAARDPLKRHAQFLIENELASENELLAIRHDVDREINDRSDAIIVQQPQVASVNSVANE